MITVFNRKELAVTYSIKRQSEIRGILEANQIDYVIDTNGTVMRNVGGNRMMLSQVWEKPEQGTEYKIYVKKQDYERAAQLIK